MLLIHFIYLIRRSSNETDARLLLLCLIQFFSTKSRSAGKNVTEKTYFVSVESVN